MERKRLNYLRVWMCTELQHGFVAEFDTKILYRVEVGHPQTLREQILLR